ncbi:hypothetical protein CTI12_AA194290 [Artemisia annua]|uniref:Uncharacterized protein n=1 Tax=Artemisia annua TaxID=35608 RepID=A0A2U1P4E4_ARTAN|nr:hypothetical protein CTI12_AA194290 [Artemisia annua]
MHKDFILSILSSPYFRFGPEDMHIISRKVCDHFRFVFISISIGFLITHLCSPEVAWVVARSAECARMDQWETESPPRRSIASSTASLVKWGNRFSKFVKYALDTFNTICNNDLLSDTTSASAPNMMKTLAKCYFGVIEKDLVAKYSLSPRQLAILSCIRAPHAQDFLFTIPIVGLGQRMNHRQFRSVLCYRLVIPMFAEGSLCPSCNVHRMDQWGDHAVHCSSEVDCVDFSLHIFLGAVCPWRIKGVCFCPGDNNRCDYPVVNLQCELIVWTASWFAGRGGPGLLDFFFNLGFAFNRLHFDLAFVSSDFGYCFVDSIGPIIMASLGAPRISCPLQGCEGCSGGNGKRFTKKYFIDHLGTRHFKTSVLKASQQARIAGDFSLFSALDQALHQAGIWLCGECFCTHTFSKNCKHAAGDVVLAHRFDEVAIYVKGVVVKADGTFATDEVVEGTASVTPTLGVFRRSCVRLNVFPLWRGLDCTGQELNDDLVRESDASSTVFLGLFLDGGIT